MTLRPFLIFEGSDVRANLEVTLGRLRKQIKELEGETINVEGKALKLKQFGVFDLCALNTILGKQNHSATYFDAWTDCTLDHIRKHSGHNYTTSTCKDIKFLSLDAIDNYFTHHSLIGCPPLTELIYPFSFSSFDSIFSYYLLDHLPSFQPPLPHQHHFAQPF